MIEAKTNCFYSVLQSRIIDAALVDPASTPLYQAKIL
jgi:hypothetical protein